VKFIKKHTAHSAAQSPVRTAVLSMRQAWIAVGLLSMFVNILMLTGPLYMLQVYDRVITSQSMSTLAVLSILMLAMYGFMGLLDFFRSRLLVRIGTYVDDELSAPLFKNWLRQGVRGKVPNAQKPLQNLSIIKRFLTGPAPTTFFDVPWTPIYIGVIFMIDWTLGVFAILGAIVVLMVAIAAELRTRNKEKISQASKAKSHQFTQKVYANSESVISMGMSGEMIRRWENIKREGEENDLSASDISGGATALSKAFRMFLQSAILGIGAALAIQGTITPGAMIAGSIILGRALAPIQMIIGQWRSYIRTKNAYSDLTEFYAGMPAAPEKVSLPAPTGVLLVDRVSAGPPGAKKATLKNLNFKLSPGDGLCILGPSGSGKSSLARLLVGVWMPQQGSVRLDGATLDQWETEDLGKHVGYLAQKAELFEGTVGENISRFRANVPPEAIIRAAQIAGFHEFILSLPEGYNTLLGRNGVILSVGQIQRLALARAVFGDPCLIVLDEPNSNLDSAGDKALNAAVQYMRSLNKTVIIISHRPTAMAAVNKVLILNGGQQEKFGLKEQIFKIGKPPVRKPQMDKASAHGRASTQSAAPQHRQTVSHHGAAVSAPQG